MPKRASRSVALISKQKQLGILQKGRASSRAMDEKIKEVEEEIRIKRETVMELEGELLLANKEIGNLEHKITYRNKRLNELKESSSAVSSEFDAATEEEKKKHCIKVTTRLKNNRKRNATRAGLNHTQIMKRRKQTWRVAHVLHGGGDDNPEPSLRGLYDTLCAKEKSASTTRRILGGKRSIVVPLKKTVIRHWSSSYVSSDANIKRSMNIYYAHCPAGKRKYELMRRAGRSAVHGGVKVPNLVPYKLLAANINAVEIGELMDVNPSLTTAVGGVSAVGRYRDTRTHLPRLAQFYLEADSRREDKLIQFPYFEKSKIDSESFVFVVLIGGDGAPACGTTVLVSYLNVGERIPSSDETYMLLGTDAEESAPVVRQYLNVLVHDLEFLESQVFNVEVDGMERKVEFRVGLCPNDMKMLSFLAGELNNKAHYFTTFAVVSKTNHRLIGYTFGDSSKDNWRPFSYCKRVTDAEKVSAFKAKQEAKNITEVTKRSNLTKFIASCESRQEEVPLIGKYIDHAMFEPLHGKNNTVKELFVKLMSLASSNSVYGKVKEYSQLSSNVLFVKFVQFVRKTMSCNKLAKKMQSWFSDQDGKCESDFGYRFRGQESRAFLSYFPELIRLLLSNVASGDRERVLRVHYQAVLLRRLISVSVRITDISEDEIKKAKEDGAALFKACVLFDPDVTPTMWCFTNVMAHHSSQTYKKFGMGLGCNTMEEREQKHQKIAKYQTQSTWHNRWDTAFRHEFVSLIYLRENGFDKTRYRTRSIKYVPEVTSKHCHSCIGLLQSNGTCGLCDHPLMADVKKCLAQKRKESSKKI